MAFPPAQSKSPANPSRSIDSMVAGGCGTFMGMFVVVVQGDLLRGALVAAVSHLQNNTAEEPRRTNIQTCRAAHTRLAASLGARWTAK
eukprot:692975-Prymnesium_polylepis.1